MMDTIVAPVPAQHTGQWSACIQRLFLIFQVSGHHAFYPFGSETELGPQILWWQPGTTELPPKWSNWGCNSAAKRRLGICWCDTRIWSKSEWTGKVVLSKTSMSWYFLWKVLSLLLSSDKRIRKISVLMCPLFLNYHFKITQLLAWGTFFVGRS